MRRGIFNFNERGQGGVEYGLLLGATAIALIIVTGAFHDVALQALTTTICGIGESDPNSAECTVPEPGSPTAAFTVSCVELACSFDASGSSDDDGIVTYVWDYGDTGMGTGINVNRTYSNPGIYVATLTVTDSDGKTDSTSEPVFVTVANNIPTAAFSFSCSGATCTFDASASSDSDGSIASYDWDFGDSNSFGTVNPTTTHTYNANNTYTVELTVTDDAGSSASHTNTVTVNVGNFAPSADFTFNCTNLSCSFNAATSSDPDGSIVNYSWDYGDSQTGSGLAPNHTFPFNGGFTVTLVVEDDGGAADTTQKTVTVSNTGNTSPNADFTFSCTGLVCGFDASGSTDSDGSITAYIWDFGDGHTGSGVNASHTYSVDDSYAVTVTVTDNEGATHSTTKGVATTSGNNAPAAQFTFTCTGFTCTFDASGSSDSDGSIDSYDWDFGDGNTATGETVNHTFVNADTFSVTLTVHDNIGADDSATESVTVAAANNAPNASFSITCSDLSCNFNNTSTDPDGDAIVSYLWNFNGAGSFTSGDATSTSGTYEYNTGGTYFISLTVEDEHGASDSASQSQTVSAAPAGDRVVSLSLINADNDQVVSGYDSISNGATIDLGALGVSNISIRANTDPSIVGSVRFGLNGNANIQTESAAPYALAGDSGGDYHNWSYSFDTLYTLTATPYENSNAGGAAGTALTISFTLTNGSAPPNQTPTLSISAPGSSSTITQGDSINFAGSANDAEDGNLSSNISWSSNLDGGIGSGSSVSTSSLSIGTHTITAAVTDSGGLNAVDSVTVTVEASSPGNQVISFSLINADTDQVVSGYESISDGATIDLGALGVTNINIRANTSPSTVGSVRFGLNGNANAQTESSPPYALAGDSGGNYSNWSYNFDTLYTLTGTPYENSNAGGAAGTALTISFTLTDTTPTPSTMYISAMQGYSQPAGSKWRAYVDVTVRDDLGNPVSGVTVRIDFSRGGANKTCSTDGNGQCTIQSNKINNSKSSSTATIDTINGGSLSYDSGSNVQNQVTISKP